MKTTITKAEHLQLVGLLALARHHDKALEDIKAAAVALLRVSPKDRTKGDGPSLADDYVGDAVFGSLDLDTMLQRLGVKVKPQNRESGG